MRWDVTERLTVKVRVESWESSSVRVGSNAVSQCLIAASSIRRHSLFLLCPDLCTEKQGKNTPAQVF